MRPFDRDLIRGRHYGQRSCEPHSQAEHMAAPTNAAFVKKALANSEPSTHGPFETCGDVRCAVAIEGKADSSCSYLVLSFLDPFRTRAFILRLRLRARATSPAGSSADET